MAGLTGLFHRGSSYYMRVVLPPRHPLQTKYKNGKFVTSLGHCSYREAVKRGTIKRAEVLFGDTLQTQPVVHQVVTQSTKHTLRDIHGLWTTGKARSKDTICACLRAVCLYETFSDNLPVEDLTRDLGGTFCAWLRHPDRKTASKTARDRLIWVKSLLQFASQDLGLIRQSPWAGVDIEFRTTNKRRPWTANELSTFFKQPLHLDYLLPDNKKAGLRPSQRFHGGSSQHGPSSPFPY